MVYNPKNFRACGAQIEFPPLILFGETPKIQYRNRYLRLVFLKFFSPAARILSFLHREGYQQYARGPGRRQVWGNHHSIAIGSAISNTRQGPGAVRSGEITMVLPIGRAIDNAHNCARARGGLEKEEMS